MQESVAHFEQIRIKNRKTIKNLMRNFEKVGKTELANVSGLSFPTVSGVLKELAGSGEALVVETVSNGGRPGEEFALNPEFELGACAYIENMTLWIMIVDALGKEKQNIQIALHQSLGIEEIEEIFMQIRQSFPRLSVIALGIPGVVLDGTIKHLPILPQLRNINVKAALEKRLEKVVVFIENDVNTIVSAERKKWKNLAHIFMTDGCIGTGILIQGNLLRGVHGCAGELEYICDEKGDILQYLSKAIGAIVCVIDTADIALSGFTMQEKEMQELIEKLERFLPRERLPQLHVVEDANALYRKGLSEMVVEEWKTR